MLDLKNYKYIIFDFDGVIIDSNHFKTKAFIETVKNEKKEYAEKFINYHKNNFNVSRYKKFKFFLSNIKKIKEYNKELQDMIEKYSYLNRKYSEKSRLIYGIKKFLHNLSAELNCKLIVISSSDEEDVKYVLKKKKLFNYFDLVLGSPGEKDANFNKIYSCKKTNERVLSFGDAKSDFLISKKYNFDFIYVSSKSLWYDDIKLKKQIKIDIYNFSQKFISSNFYF